MCKTLILKKKLKTQNENKLPENAKGIFEKQNHTVTYVYRQNKEIKNSQKDKQIKEQLPLAGEKKTDAHGWRTYSIMCSSISFEKKKTKIVDSTTRIEFF